MPCLMSAYACRYHEEGENQHKQSLEPPSVRAQVVGYRPTKYGGFLQFESLVCLSMLVKKDSNQV